jgi:hypothetical protein
MEQPGNVSQCMKMFLKLTLRYEEQHHQLDRVAVQRIKLNPLA